MSKPKVLFFDIETAPTLGYVWKLWQADVIDIEKHWHMISFAVGWAGQKTIKCYSLRDFKDAYNKDPDDDSALTAKLWEYFDEADIIIGHNSDKFDIRKANARFIEHGFPPPSPYLTVDTLKQARKHFKFESNRLDALGEYLGVGRKAQSGGWRTWKGCMEGKAASWKQLKTYNTQDVQLLKDVYYKMLPWITNHPNLNVFSQSDGCPNCGSHDVVKQGTRITRTGKYQRYKCNSCGAWSSGKFVPDTRVEIR